MGEMAEGLINGDFDFYTGEYLGRGGGFPRSRDRSFWGRQKNSPNYKKNPRRGIMNYIQMQYCGRAKSPKAIKVAKQFFHEMNGEFISQEKMFESISANFKLFVEWMDKNKDHLK